MTALAKPRNSIQHRGPYLDYDFLVKASAVVIQTGLVILISGYAAPGKTGADSTEAGTFQCVGVAMESVTGGASNGDKSVKVRAAEWPFYNSTSGDLITVADIGKVAYLVDDQTVAKTSNTNVRCIAGRITGVDPDGTVWVRVGPGLAA